MRILVVGPLPPPMTGNALPVKVLCDALPPEALEVVNLSKKEHKAGITSIGRVLEIVRCLIRVYRKQKKSTVVYLTIAESFAGNFRDLVIYWFSRKRLTTVIVHMFGGAGMQSILKERGTVQFRLNRYFLNRVGAIVVEGQPQADMFLKAVNHERVYVVPNFAEPFLFTDGESVRRKFASNAPLKILFLSNMLPGKGYRELMTAFENLPDSISEQYQLTFAGKTISSDDEEWLIGKADSVENIRYVGPVYGEEKKRLFNESHVFCLPTYYAYEGQPFSIIEAYASGCAVISTNHSGIKYIFQDAVNGYLVEKRSPESLIRVLARIPAEKERLLNIALNNLRQATELYTADQYINRMKDVFNTVALKAHT